MSSSVRSVTYVHSSSVTNGPPSSPDVHPATWHFTCLTLPIVTVSPVCLLATYVLVSTFYLGNPANHSYTHVEWLFRTLGYHPRSYTLVEWLFMSTREPPFIANMMSSHHTSPSVHQAENITNCPALGHDNFPLPSARKKILNCPALRQKNLPLPSAW